MNHLVRVERPRRVGDRVFDPESFHYAPVVWFAANDVTDSIMPPATQCAVLTLNLRETHVYYLSHQGTSGRHLGGGWYWLDRPIAGDLVPDWRRDDEGRMVLAGVLVRPAMELASCS